MGSFEIGFLQEGVELGLLLYEVDAGRASGFSFQGKTEVARDDGSNGGLNDPRRLLSKLSLSSSVRHPSFSSFFPPGPAGFHIAGRKASPTAHSLL
jgi:hypothetical protein